jgi:cyclopropane fatty-acyl-phospholipid synthase-like methyltransferase
VTYYWRSFWRKHATESQRAEPLRQVLRLQSGQPVAPDTVAAIVASVTDLLEPSPGHTLLDLGCGNGLLTRHLFDKFGRVLAVDVSAEFTTQLGLSAPSHVAAWQADVATVELPPASVDRVLCYSVAQYLSEAELAGLFLRMRSWMRVGGLAVIGDIPDVTRMWMFFNSIERERAHFDALVCGRPIIGHWFDPVWLTKLARHAGFEAEIRPQPARLPYQHYRFDLIMRPQGETL